MVKEEMLPLIKKKGSRTPLTATDIEAPTGKKEKYTIMDEGSRLHTYEYENGTIQFWLQETPGREKLEWALEAWDTENHPTEPLVQVKGTDLLEVEARVGRKLIRRSLHDCLDWEVRVAEVEEDLLPCIGKIGFKVEVVARFPGLCAAVLELAVPCAGGMLAARARVEDLETAVELDWIRFLGGQVVFGGLPSGHSDGRAALRTLWTPLAALLLLTSAAALTLGAGLAAAAAPLPSLPSAGQAALAAALGALTILGLRALLLRLRHAGPRTFFYNGWNAWSFTGAVRQGHRTPPPRMPGVCVRAFHQGAELRRGFGGRRGDAWLASEMHGFLADPLARRGLAAGFLAQRQQFGAISLDRSFRRLGFHAACDGLCLPRGGGLGTDWAVLHPRPRLPAADPLGPYLEAAAAHCGARGGAWRPASGGGGGGGGGGEEQRGGAGDDDGGGGAQQFGEVPVGWCSWYDFFEKVTEADLRANLESVGRLARALPLPLFQIDDGYQAAWGDWLDLDRSKFPGEMADLAAAIRAAGLTPGLWLAPFAADKGSAVAAAHPHWVLRNKPGVGAALGRPANSANCGKWFLGLDARRADVRARAAAVLRTVAREWGFSYVKLDFLYAAILKGAETGKHGLTRAQTMQLALQTIREAIGEEVYFLGCGAPIGSGLGWVDANRVSSDAGLSWAPELPLPPSDKWNLPCARNMTRSTLCRAHFHGRWWANDPDCLILRQGTRFDDDELQGMCTVKAMSAGSVLISDDLAAIPEYRRRWAAALLPPAPRAAAALDLLTRECPEDLRLDFLEERGGAAAAGPWSLVALCNWRGRRRERRLRARHLRPLLRRAAGAGGGGGGGTAVLFLMDFWRGEVAVVPAPLRPPPPACRGARSGEEEEEDCWEDGDDDGGDGEAPPLRTYAVPRHGATLLAARVAADPHQALYIGSDLHFSCGLEVTTFSHTVNQDRRHALRLGLGVRRGAAGRVWLHLPGCGPEGPPRVTQQPTNAGTKEGGSGTSATGKTGGGGGHGGGITKAAAEEDGASAEEGREGGGGGPSPPRPIRVAGAAELPGPWPVAVWSVGVRLLGGKEEEQFSIEWEEGLAKGGV